MAITQKNAEINQDMIEIVIEIEIKEEVVEIDITTGIEMMMIDIIVTMIINKGLEIVHKDNEDVCIFNYLS